MPLWRRRERASLPLTVPPPSTEVTTLQPIPRSRASRFRHPQDENSRRLLIMAQHHLLAWLVCMYILLMVCRFGFGWTPGQDKPPPTITIGGDKMMAIAHNNVTIVTAYFDTLEHNETWMKYILSLQHFMVVFTSPYLIETLKEWRGPSQQIYTQFIPLHWNETYMVQTYGMNFREEDGKVESEQGSAYRPPKASDIVQYEAPHLLKQAVSRDDFHNEFFAWVDTKSLRDNDWLKVDRKTSLIRYIPRRLQRNQVLLLNAPRILDSGVSLTDNFLAGFKEGALRWEMKYYEMLEATHKDHRFDTKSHKDQPSMAIRACTMYSNGCITVDARSLVYGDSWFPLTPPLQSTSSSVNAGLRHDLHRIWHRSVLRRIFTSIITPWPMVKPKLLR